MKPCRLAKHSLVSCDVVRALIERANILEAPVAPICGPNAPDPSYMSYKTYCAYLRLLGGKK